MSKIMLVEDDPMIAEIYKKKFEMAGFEVVNAVNGKEVLKFAEESKFDLILLDMVLPEISGMEVLKELKMSGNYSADLKIIVFSNLDRAEHEEEARKNGADGFIGKTQYSPSELVVEIQRLLREGEERKKNKIRFEKKDGNENQFKNEKKILFIEDEKIFIEMFGKKLEDEDYFVEYAENGAWGSRLAIEKEFDLIITDMVMPAMSGKEIVQNLKMNEKTKNIPIIVISASVSEEDIEFIRSLGVTDFYEKTRIVPSDLSRRVAELLK
jgi:DNA-binding response OmpR family regulator